MTNKEHHDNQNDMGEVRARLIVRLNDKTLVPSTLGRSRIGLLVVDEPSFGSASLASGLSLTQNFERVLGSRNLKMAEEIVDKGGVNIVIINARIREGRKTAFDLVQSLAGRPNPVKSIMIRENWQPVEIIEAFSHGARGLLTTQPVDIERTSKAVVCVNKGQIWADSEQLAHALNYFARMEWNRRSKTSIGASLTMRETEIAKLLSQGASNKEIAECLHISERTVKNHLRNIFEKMDVSSRVQAVLRLVS